MCLYSTSAEVPCAVYHTGSQLYSQLPSEPRLWAPLAQWAVLCCIALPLGFGIRNGKRDGKPETFTAVAHKELGGMAAGRKPEGHRLTLHGLHAALRLSALS